MRLIHLFVILLLTTLVHFCNATTKIDSLWNELHKNKNAIVEINLLSTLGDCYKQTEQKSLYDSCYELVFTKSQLLNNDKLMAEKYRQYFNLFDDNFETKNKLFANKYISFATNQNVKNDLFYANIILFKLQLDKNIDSSETYLKNAQYYATSINNTYYNAIIMISLGSINELKNNKINAYRNYLDAQILTQINNYTDLHYYVTDKIINLLNVTKNYNLAKAEAIKQLTTIAKTTQFDSLNYFKTISRLSDITFNLNEDEDAEIYANNVIQYAERNQNVNLKNDELLIVRSKYLEKNNLHKIAQLYSKQFPEELHKLSITDTLTYYRIQSAIKENENKTDSSLYFFSEAEKVLAHTNKSSIYLSNFYRRYAQLFYRLNNLTQAENNYKKCLAFSSQNQYYPYILEAAQMLDSINYTKKNYATAYQYKDIYLSNLIKYNESQKSDDILKLGFENEINQRTIEEKQEELHTEKKHNVQYTIIFISLLSCFLILTILGSIRVPKYVIKALGYISFVFLFELIILIADEKIHHLTHGEPLYIIGIKIILISFLLPIHHWVEHKAIHFLFEHRLIKYSKIRELLVSFKNTITEIYTPKNDDENEERNLKM